MSAELNKARKNLTNIPSLMKQDKLLAAVTALQEGLTTFLKGNLMQSEKKEFLEMIDRSLHALNSNQALRQVYPVLLKLEPGKEKELLQNVRELQSALQEEMTSEAKESLAEMEKRKTDTLEKARSLLKEGQQDKADASLRKLVREFTDDFDLKINIADILISAEAYEKALDYLKMAYRDNPRSVHIYNRLGMALRKLGRFEDSEKAYSQALKITPQDEYLHFNMGRLYMDMQQWNKALHSAYKALEINPDFEQARKMLHYSQKKI
ncbi:Tetratricopeptide TPR_2 repeat protein [Desulfonatronospira thiodismutans ASO3-1]|uniref:Tetratricopeptide TPR_2 repeat protein n=1 Tax=Desulfonatronospira thiodismutans ASO3-1 TaxID=555779 RepID=D6SMF4_9BACT|nr:tetratricopeptide repeat protein [Desulfonatronospira thiodismutans]EFI35865.1 Tetratricopeptide TPR_2 repeat protein [Desulfonatronospira thiodismutans ASO3-1]